MRKSNHACSGNEGINYCKHLDTPSLCFRTLFGPNRRGFWSSLQVHNKNRECHASEESPYFVLVKGRIFLCHRTQTIRLTECNGRGTVRPGMSASPFLTMTFWWRFVQRLPSTKSETIVGTFGIDWNRLEYSQNRSFSTLSMTTSMRIYPLCHHVPNRSQIHPCKVSAEWPSGARQGLGRRCSLNRITFRSWYGRWSRFGHV